MDDAERDAAISELEFQRAIFDGLSANIAILDSHGTILAVNAAWRAFGESNGMADVRFGVGANYLSVCQAAVDPDARAALAGIQDVLSGARSSYYFEYACHSPDERRWFALRATPLAGFPNFVMTAHENITERVVAEAQVRERNKLLQAQLVESAVGTHSPDAPVPANKPPARQTTVLLVDDDAPLLQTITIFLESKSVRVYPAADAPSAIEILESGLRPDCIVTDYHMPGMTGVELILRAREYVGDIATVIMSGDVLEETISAANLGHCTLIQKPFVFSNLLELVNEGVSEH